MKLTNFYNLPEPIVQLLIKLSQYQRKSDYSVTELINPIQIVLLRQRHYDEIEEDASDQIWRLLGILLHLALEQVDVKNHLQEEAIRLQVLKRTISGRTDLYSHEKKITDYKLTSSYSKVFGSRTKEWTEQLNCCAWLYRSIGFEVNEIELFIVYRDWSAGKAKGNQDYPQKNNEVLKLQLWDYEKQTDYIHDKVSQLIQYENTPDDKLPECTSEDMWERPTTYALMKHGRKSAIRVFDEIEPLNNYIFDNIPYSISKIESSKRGMALEEPYWVDIRLGERVRCESYCSVNKFCTQFAKYKEAKDDNNS
jgi:hypothetical protein